MLLCHRRSISVPESGSTKSLNDCLTAHEKHLTLHVCLGNVWGTFHLRLGLTVLHNI